MSDETNLTIFRSQGFHLWPKERMERMLFGEDIDIHFSGPHNGKFIAWVQDWEENETLLSTPPIFLSSEAGTLYLRDLLQWLRKVWPIYLAEKENIVASV